MTRYVLTGTTGKLGSRILRSILEKGDIPPADLIISSSNPARVPAIAHQYGVEIRGGNFMDASSMRTAFDGADVLFLMSHPDPGTERVALHRNAIETARAVGVKTIIYSSMMLGGETGLESTIGIQQGHIHTMHYLAQAQIDHVIVRQGIYAEGWANYVSILPPGFDKSDDPRTLHLAIPQDFGIAWTALDELGEGNAAILARYRDYLGETLRLTGPRVTTISEIARLIEGNTGRPVALHLLGSQAMRGWYPALVKGEGEVVDPLLGRLLGRPPRGIAEMADELFEPFL